MQVYLFQFSIAHFYAGWIGVCIELARNSQSIAGVCGRNQVYHYLVADQGASAPVLSDAGKQSMLYLVPFAGTRREMADADGEAGLIGQSL